MPESSTPEFKHEFEESPQVSPSMPIHNIVQDEQDQELEKGRETLANIRMERAESWQIDSTDR